MAPQDNPKVTVLISTFNRPQYLAEAIQSVVDQRFQNWELIVLNDGGVDVAEVVERFRDPRVIYVPDEVNRGAARRFNQGLALARGEYVTYLGDDDVFYPNHLEVLAKALDEHPEVALAYSDLYAVSSISERSGRRYALDKRISVSRGFNREFMFHYNHVLHVSLMHRLDAARRVGGFDEKVKVLIEWSLNRRLAFLYDFYHVEEVTGEYHMPVFKSDRISVRERRDSESYKHNLRKIRCSFPAEPWDKIERIDLIYVVDEWGEKLNSHLKGIIDNFDHPFKIYLVNNGTGRTFEQVKKSMGNLTELKNINIVQLTNKLQPLLAMRKVALRSNAKYLFLVTPQLAAAKMPKRLFATLQVFADQPEIRAIRWDVPEEKGSQFDCLIERKYFLEHSKPGKNVVNIQAVSIRLAKGFKFDAMFAECRKNHKAKKYKEAREIMDLILKEKEGYPHEQYLIHYMAPLYLAQKDYAGLEKELRALIDRGYRPDNLARLGVMLWRQGRNAEAVETLKQALAAHGLNEESFQADCFPLMLPRELGVFHIIYTLGEAYLALGDSGEAARYYHLASRLQNNGYKPLLGFAKVYFQSGQLDRAEVALSKLPGRNGQDNPETQRLLAKLCQRRKQPDLAFECIKKAFELAPEDENNVDPFYFLGAALGKWEEMTGPLGVFLQHNPEHGGALARIAAVYFNCEFYSLAQDAAAKCLAVDPQNPVAKSISERIKNKLAKLEDPSLAVETVVSVGGLKLDLANIGPIAW